MSKNKHNNIIIPEFLQIISMFSVKYFFISPKVIIENPKKCRMPNTINSSGITMNVTVLMIKATEKSLIPLFMISLDFQLDIPDMNIKELEINI